MENTTDDRETRQINATALKVGDQMLYPGARLANPSPHRVVHVAIVEDAASGGSGWFVQVDLRPVGVNGGAWGRKITRNFDRDATVRILIEAKPDPRHHHTGATGRQAIEAEVRDKLAVALMRKIAAGGRITAFEVRRFADLDAAASGDNGDAA